MSRNRHHHHIHHKRYSCSNCCIGINTIGFIVTLIVGSIITAVVLVPSILYKDEWEKINCSLIGKDLTSYCQNSSECRIQSNQVIFPSYFYVKNNQYNSLRISSTTNESSNDIPINQCNITSSSPFQCFKAIINFNYPTNSTYTDNQGLYVKGDLTTTKKFLESVQDSVFPCWMNINNSSQLSIIPIPLYSPGAVIAVGILFTFSLLSLILILIFISIRCFCKNNNNLDYLQPLLSEISNI